MRTDERTGGQMERLTDRHYKVNNRFSQFSERARYYGKVEQISINIVIDYVLANRIAE
jgi:hypothetical protein